MEISRRIRAARRAKGLTAAAFARVVEVSPTAVANWERGVNIPKPDMLQRIATVLDVSTDHLQGGIPALQNESLNASVAQILDETKRNIANKLGIPMIMIRVVVEITR